MIHMVRAICLILCCLLVSCTPIEKVPSLDGTLVSSETVTTLLDRSQKRKNSIRSFKALLRVKISRGSESQSQRLAIVYRAPKDFKIEFYPTTSFYLLQKTILTDGRYTSVDMVRGKSEQGEIGEGTLEDVIGLPLTLTMLQQILLATLPEDKYEAVRSTSDGSLHALSESNDVYAELPGDRVVPAMLKFFSESGTKIIGARYSAYQTIQDVMIPEQIELDIPRHQVKVEISVSSAKINAAIAPSEFTVSLPLGSNED